MSAQSTRATAKPSSFSSYVAMYATVAAFSIVTLVVQASVMGASRWLGYVLGVIVYVIILTRTTRHETLPLRWLIASLVAQTTLVIVLTILSDFYFLTAMLSFITVSVIESSLPRPKSFLAIGVLLVVLTLAFTAAVGMNAGLQIFLGLGAGFLFMSAFTRAAQSERQAREQLEVANQQLAEYAAQVSQLATMRERNRLAREVHDSLGHYLTVINVQLEVVTKLLESNPSKALEAAKRAKELASEGLSEVRRSVAALRPSPLDDRSLPDALTGLIDTAREAGLLVTFEQSGLRRTLTPEVETVLYRATQEALTNIRKHAHASTAQVRLAFDPNAVSLSIRDNGVGRQHDEDNVGLTALRERVTALNGTVAAENHPEGGFWIEVTLPT
ncbi:MAG: sensor histidine kinase [Anaerolineae bacterium]